MRQMPLAGYYVYKNAFSGPYMEVIYTTGQVGGGGHKYFRNGQWATLLWSCVPGKKEILEYTYYPTLPPGIPAYA